MSIKFGVLKVILFSFIIVAITSFVFFFLTSLFILLGKGGNVEEDVVSDTKHFQYLAHDSNTDEITMGMVSLPLDAVEREKKGFIEYESDGVQVLISDFQSTEYMCTGTCSCDDFYRRGASSVASRTLTYLAASGTALLAASYAREYFKDKCESVAVEMGCGKDHVKSTVEECERPDNHPDVDTSDWDHRSFMCVGNCVPNVYGEREKPEYDLPEEYHQDATEYQCAFMEYEMEIKMDTASRENAELEFMTKHLKYFCLDNSMKEYEDFTCLDSGPDQCDIVRPPASKESMKICVSDTDVDTSRDTKARESGGVTEGRCVNLKPERTKKSMCHGYIDGAFAFGGRYHNPSVKCRPLTAVKKKDAEA